MIRKGFAFAGIIAAALLGSPLVASAETATGSSDGAPNVVATFALDGTLQDPATIGLDVVSGNLPAAPQDGTLLSLSRPGDPHDRAYAPWAINRLVQNPVPLAPSAFLLLTALLALLGLACWKQQRAPRSSMR